MKSELRLTEMLQWTGEGQVSLCARASRSWPAVHTSGVRSAGVVTTGIHTSGVHTTGVVTTGVFTTGVHTTGVITTGVFTTGVHTTGVATTGVHTTGFATTGAYTSGVLTTGGCVQDLESRDMFQLASIQNRVTDTRDLTVETTDTMSGGDSVSLVVGNFEVTPGANNPLLYTRRREDEWLVINGESGTRLGNLRPSSPSSSDQSLPLCTASSGRSDARQSCNVTCLSVGVREENIQSSYKYDSSNETLRGGEGSKCVPQSSVVLCTRGLTAQKDLNFQPTSSGDHTCSTTTPDTATTPDTMTTPDTATTPDTTTTPDTADGSPQNHGVDSSHQIVFQTFDSPKHSPDNSRSLQASHTITLCGTINRNKQDCRGYNCSSCASKGNILFTGNSENHTSLKNCRYNFSIRSERFPSNPRIGVPGYLPTKLLLLSDRLAVSFLQANGPHRRIRWCQSLPELGFLAPQSGASQPSSRTSRPTSKVSEYLDLHLGQRVNTGGSGGTVNTCGTVDTGGTVYTGANVNTRRRGKVEEFKPTPCPSQSSASRETKCRRLEASHVHQVYQMIAPQCDHVRHKAWPKVKQFLKGLEPGSLVADVGCGSGRYLSVNPQVLKFGSDICRPFLEQARCQGHEVLMADNMALPYRDGVFDAVCSIGVIHHFASLDRRVNALGELSRVLAPGGKLMVYVWAFEQTNRKFNCQDVLIPWIRPNTKSEGHSRADLRDQGRNTNASCSADDSEHQKSAPPSPCYQRADRKRVKSQGDWEVTGREDGKGGNDTTSLGQGDHCDGPGKYPRRRLFSDDGPYSKCRARRSATRDARDGNEAEAGNVECESDRSWCRRTPCSETRQVASGGDASVCPWRQNDSNAVGDTLAMLPSQLVSDVVGGKLAKLPSQLVSECRKLGKLLRSLSLKSDSSCGDDYVELDFNEAPELDEFDVTEAVSSSSAREEITVRRPSETTEEKRHSETGEEDTLDARECWTDTSEVGESFSTRAFPSESNEELRFPVDPLWGQSASRQDDTVVPNREVAPTDSSSFCGSDAAASTECPSWCSDTTVVSEDLDTRSTVTLTDSELFNQVRSGKARVNPFSKTPPEISPNISVTEQTTTSSNSGRQKSFSGDTSAYSSDSVFLDRQSSETEETSSSDEGESDQSVSSETAGVGRTFIGDVLGVQDTGQYTTGNMTGSGGALVKGTSTYYNTINNINARARYCDTSTTTPCQTENPSISQGFRNMFSKITEAFHVKKKDAPVKMAETKVGGSTKEGLRKFGTTQMRPTGSGNIRKPDQATLQYYREISLRSSQQAYQNLQLQTDPESGRASTHVHNLVKGRRPTFLDFTKKRCRASSQLVSRHSSVEQETRKLTLSDALTLLGEGVSEESLLDKLDSTAKIVFREMKLLNFGIRQFPMSSVEQAVVNDDEIKFNASLSHDTTQNGQPMVVTKAPQGTYPQTFKPEDQPNERLRKNSGEVFSLKECSRDYFSSTSDARGNSLTIAHERRMSIQLDGPSLDSYGLLEQPVCSMWSEPFQDRSNNARATETDDRQLRSEDVKTQYGQGREAPEEINCYSRGKLAPPDRSFVDQNPCSNQEKTTGQVSFKGRTEEPREGSNPRASQDPTCLFQRNTPILVQCTPTSSNDASLSSSQDTQRSLEHTSSSTGSTTRTEPNAATTTTTTIKHPEQTTAPSSVPSGHLQANTNLSRYYHVFKRDELVRLIAEHVPSLRVQENYYDHANWCIVARKI